MPGMIAGGILGFLIAASITLIIIFTAVFYVYFSFAWMTIAGKLKQKHSWLAWVPVARTALIFNMGDLPWPLVFLYLVPILGWIAIFILLIIAKWKIFERRNYPGWFSLSSLLMGVPKAGILLYAVVLGFVAWVDRKKMLKV
ncbi:MAG: hypothetical protein ABIA62_08110 [Candidatus Woesearchaeota archaeon]